jgi:hypothetical protein
MRLALALLLTAPFVAHAGVYKCVDSTGKATYSDKPCTGNESRAGMDVKGMTYSSDEVMYFNERAASIIQSERAAQEAEEQAVEPVRSAPGSTAKDAQERKSARKQAQKAERDEHQRKAASAGIQNGGTPWIPAAGGAIDPKTGEFKVDAAGGYVDPKTGKFIPASGK